MAADLFYLHDLPGALRFEIRGVMSEGLADAVVRSLQTALSIAGGRPVFVDLRHATDVEPGAAAKLAEFAGATLRFVFREDHLPLMASLAPRTAAPAGESPQPQWRRTLCRLASMILRGCRCLSCAATRFWMI